MRDTPLIIFNLLFMHYHVIFKKTSSEMNMHATHICYLIIRSVRRIKAEIKSYLM